MPLLKSVHLVEKEFQVSSEDPLEIFGRSILGARWRTGAGMRGAAVSLACTYPCRLRYVGATASAMSSVAYVHSGNGQRYTGIVTDKKQRHEQKSFFFIMFEQK